MKLLFLTQVLDADDAVLGFVSRWVRGLAQHAERVRVVALQVGEIGDLPPNVDVREVGRRGTGWSSTVSRYLRYRRFLSEALGRDGFDTVLGHMVPRYCLVAAGPARRAGARNFLWYTHKGVDRRLIAAERCVEAIFTASPESLRIDTPKKIVTGHGIDLEHFRPKAPPEGEPKQPPRILSVGRVTPAKDPLTILDAVARLVDAGRDLHLDLVGGGLAAGDGAYGERVRERIETLGLAPRVVQHGAVSYRRVPALYAACSLLVNASFTGSVDKVVLEAMASGRPVLSCNESFGHVFRSLGPDAAQLSFAAGDAADLARRMAHLLDLGQEQKRGLSDRLRAIVAREHEVDQLMGRLVSAMAGDPRSIDQSASACVSSGEEVVS